MLNKHPRALFKQFEAKLLGRATEQRRDVLGRAAEGFDVMGRTAEQMCDVLGRGGRAGVRCGRGAVW